jgi:tetratricopeptide (TPR) repeat protein
VTNVHPTLEKLAKLLSGRMEYDELIQEFLPHLLGKCEACSALLEEIRRLKQEIGHWDELVAVLESREAPQLFEHLAAHPFEEQLRLVEEQEAFHAWGFCDLLLKRSREAASGDPQRAVDLALLAVRLSVHLGDAYDPEWVLDLRARAYAHLANGHRVLGELRSAEDAFREADALLARSLSGNATVEAEVLSFKSSLRMAQRRFDEALAILDRVIAIYKDGELDDRDLHMAGRTLVEKAICGGREVRSRVGHSSSPGGGTPDRARAGPAALPLPAP